MPVEAALTRRPVLDAMPHYIGTVSIEPRVRLRYESGQRNDLRNESWWNIDLHMAKEFRIGRKTELQLTLDVFNLLNDDSLTIIETVEGQNSSVRRFGRQFQVGFRVAF